MLIFLSIVIALFSASVLIAGLLAYLRSPQRAQNRWFLALATSLGIWLAANFVDSNIALPFWTDLALKTDIAFAPIIAWTLLGFTFALGRKSQNQHGSSTFQKYLNMLSIVLNLLIFAASYLGAFASVGFKGGTPRVNYTSAFDAYTLVIVVYFVYGFGLLFYKRAHSRSQERGALNLILGGLIFAVTANIISNVLVPSLTTDRHIIQPFNLVGYAGFVALVLCIYLAITTQKLFDIRLVVARSLGYVLSLATLGLGFVGATFVITDVLFSQGLKASALRLVYLGFAIIFALTYPQLKRYFDRATNLLFYRDAYDPQKFIDDLNRVMVTNFEISNLLKSSALVIETNLKPQFCSFVINETTSTQLKNVGSGQHVVLDENDTHILHNAFLRTRQKIIIAEALEDHQEKLRHFLTHRNIAVVARLSALSSETSSGYIIFGLKKSGNLYTTEDLNVIATIANGLSVAIQNALSFEEIKNFNLTLQEKVVEATRKLRHTNEKLKALDETKDDFISMASHQLRTPLTSVKGYISMVLEGDAGKLTDMQKDMLNQAFFSSQRMVFLIADLLNVSRLKTGKFVIEPAPINLAKLVGEEIEQLKDTAASRGLTIEFHSPDDFPDLMLDETKTRQVIMNFVDNAIYYTPAGGNIVVTLAETTSSIELRVTDNGIGVPKAEQHHLFNKFYRAANARKARPDGTGLGLFMAKKVIVGQGGSVIFESTEGKGSTFGFIFSKGKLQVKTTSLTAAAEVGAPKTPQKA